MVVVPLAIAGVYWFEQWRAVEEQEPLDAFYTPPQTIDGDPGTIIRSGAAPQWDVDGGTATRILYVTTGVDGVRRVAGGMVWVPTAPQDGERKVVAWAHGTVGLGDLCAPSRNPSLMPTMSVWIAQMMQRGWIVTATDYQGLGTPPPYSYLVGRAEAADVINSVRAARNLPGSAAVVGNVGADVTMSQALDCATTAGLLGLGRQALGQRYFTANPMSDPTWGRALTAETPDPLPGSLPLFVPVGTKDNVVLPTSIAYMQRQWCRAGSDLTMDWLGGVDHLSANSVAAPAVVDWLTDRFEGRPTSRNCAQPPPVAPYRPTS